MPRQFIAVPDESWMAAAVAVVAAGRAARRRLQPVRLPSFWVATVLLCVIVGLLIYAASL